MNQENVTHSASRFRVCELEERDDIILLVQDLDALDSELLVRDRAA